MIKLKIADRFTLPIDLITQKSAILARTGAGKTNAAVVIAEEVLAAKQQVVTLDPKGDWWGLRSSADGKQAGYPIIVLGGMHGDLPLEPTAGDVVADLVADEGVSAVLDVSEFSNAERNRFVMAFAERLYRRKAAQPDPMLLILEEADEVCPQRVGAEQARMVGAIEKIVKRGRFRGIGTLLITQRSASLNKDVLTQTEVLIVMQTTGPQDIKAIDAWIEHHPDQARRTQLLAEISRLKQGEAFIWSPSWLDLFSRIRFSMRHTYDAGRTPKVGERRIEPKVLAGIDLEILRKRMAATIEKAKAEDPRELRRRIAELERQLAEKKPEIPQPAIEPVRTVEIPVLKDSHLDRAQKLLEKLVKTNEKLAQYLEKEIRPALDRASLAGRQVRQRAPIKPTFNKPTLIKRPIRDSLITHKLMDQIRLPIGERKILAACLQFPHGLRREQLTVLTGYKRSSRDAYIARLREKELLAQNSDVIFATEKGALTLPDYQPLPIGIALRDYWMARLPSGERAVLEILLSAYPNAIERMAIDEATGYQRSSRDAYLARLAAKELIKDVGHGQVKASDNLYD